MKITIIPTGNEILNGTVMDLDSPEIMSQFLKMYPNAEITRIKPVEDIEESIVKAINKWNTNSDIIVIIGGSGGGHRYSDTLNCDFTHTALELLLKPCYSTEIYGKNGHMWSKLLCGKINDTVVFNVPGPFREAKVATETFLSVFEKNPDDLKKINELVAKSVFNTYPQN